MIEDNKMYNTASFLDKTDWRGVIQDTLELVIQCKDTDKYTIAVRKLVAVFGAVYPGFNAKLHVDAVVQQLEDAYTKLEQIWLRVNATKRWDQKWHYHQYLQRRLCDDIYTFIRDLAGQKRMLLWGHREIGGGTQIGYNDIQDTNKEMV